MRQARCNEGRVEGAGATKKRQRAARKRAVKAMAAAGAVAAGTQVYAVPVRFDNPAHGEAGHYHWVPAQAQSTKWLDLTAPAASQPAAIDDFTSLKQWNGGPYGWVRGATSGGAEVQIGGSYDMFALAMDAGNTIPSGASWGPRGFTYYTYYGSELPEGVETYLGARFNAGAGNQYGWVKVVRTGVVLEALAWGHETEPGVSIAAGAAAGPDVPAMSAYGMLAASLAALAAGAWAFRRKGESMGSSVA